MEEELGLKEVIAMGLGGTIGGGIFAALGVALKVAGNGAILTFTLAGLVALIAGYSYVQLTDNLRQDGGSYTFIEYYITNPDLAGFSGWVLIMGYIGTMGLYSYAFGAFLNQVVSEVFSIPEHEWLRMVFSCMIIILMLLINLQGTALSGTTELIMVIFKILILVMFAAIGIVGIMIKPELSFVPGGTFNEGFLAAIVAVPIIFVSFEGFELLSYEFSEMKGGIKTLKKGIYVTIISATVIYILIVIAVTGILSTSEIVANEETVLAVLAQKLFPNQLLNDIAYFLIVVAALLSTTSAINATMFGTARLMHRISRQKQLPDMYSRLNRKEVPINSLILIALLTIIMTIAGSLKQITIFASLSFIIIFTIVNYIAFRDKKTVANEGVLIFGLISTVGILILFLNYLIQDDPFMLVSVLAIFVILSVFELIFKRQKISRNGKNHSHGNH